MSFGALDFSGNMGCNEAYEGDWAAERSDDSCHGCAANNEPVSERFGGFPGTFNMDIAE